MRHYTTGKTFLDRLPHDGDLLASIRDSFIKSNSSVGFFTAIGAVKQAKIAFYGQDDHRYYELSVEEPAEILSCSGNVSNLDGRTFVHAHIILGMADGSTRGGHLLEGTRIFSCELRGTPLEGEQLSRVYDETTDLKLWSL